MKEPWEKKNPMGDPNVGTIPGMKLLEQDTLGLLNKMLKLK
jgi:hypothetical protein